MQQTVAIGKSKNCVKLPSSLILAILLLSATPTDARVLRSHRAVADFKRMEPCPSTGLARGRCPGWVIDHRVALCVGGADAPGNMRWMTVAAAKSKDRWECRPGWASKLIHEKP